MRCWLSQQKVLFKEKRKQRVNQYSGICYIPFSSDTDPPVLDTGGKDVPRTVMSFTGSLDWTVCTALPVGQEMRVSKHVMFTNKVP